STAGWRSDERRAPPAGPAARGPRARGRGRRHRAPLRLEFDAAARALRGGLDPVGRLSRHPRVPGPVAVDAGRRLNRARRLSRAGLVLAGLAWTLPNTLAGLA